MEFADGAVQDMLAVPVPRGSILLAKFVVAALWSAALALEIYLAGLALGAAIQLPGGTPAALAQSSAIFGEFRGPRHRADHALRVSGQRRARLSAAAWGGSADTDTRQRGSGDGVGGSIFPWSAPGLASQGISLPPVSYVIVALTGLAGVAATYFWWKYADQSR